MNRTHIIIGLLIVLVIIYFSQTQRENLENSNALTLSNEAIQNIASVYASIESEAKFNKIKSTGGITGNLTGDVSGNLTGDVTSKNINTHNLNSFNLNISSNALDKNKYFVGSTPETTDKDKSQYLYIAPRKEDDKDWDLTKEFEIHKSGDVKINGGIINLRFLPAEYKVIPSNEWDWPFFGKYALTFFKKSDPNGAHKTFLFRNGTTNNLWLLTYFKIENRIALVQHTEYKNFANKDGNWYFDIP